MEVVGLWIGIVTGALALAATAWAAGRWVWRHVVLPLKLRSALRRARRMQRTATDLSLKDGVLRKGCLLVAKLRTRPSSKWLDPLADVQGAWDGKRIVPLPSPLQYEGREGAPERAEPTWVPLVIPSLKVEPEWREATHVQVDPLWRSSKRYVVRRFLQSAAGKSLLCSTVIGRKKGGILVNCHDYDEYLRSEWPYFKGLEAALAVNPLYRQQHFQNMSDRDLKDFVFQSLPELLSDANIHTVPKQYRRALEIRAVDPEAVYLVLKGLIDRYKLSGIPPLPP